MRLSDLTGKEVINLGDGGRLGIIDDCELCFDAKTGKVESLLLPARTHFLNLFGDRRGTEVPWYAIKRIGEEVVIVDLSNSFERSFGFSRDRKRDTY